MSQEENDILIAEEFEVLQSIYTDEIKFSSQTNITIILDVQQDHRIELWLPVGYPTQKSLNFDVSLHDVDEVWKAQLISLIEQILAENESEPVCYALIGAIRDFYSTLPKTRKVNQVGDSGDGDSIPGSQNLSSSITPSILQKASHLKVLSSPNKIIDRKSIFQGHVVKISSTEDIELAKMLIFNSNSKIPVATHNITAYRLNLKKTNFKGESVSMLQKDCDDDGETAAGKRLLHLLDLLEVQDCYVMVTRWYSHVCRIDF